MRPDFPAFVRTPHRSLRVVSSPARFMGALVTVAALTLSLTSASATDKHNERRAELQADISSAMSELAGTNAKLQRAYTELAGAEQRLNSAQETSSAAQDAAAEAKRRHQQLVAQADAAEQATSRKRDEVHQTQELIDQTRGRIGKMAANAYQSGAVDRSMLLALTSDSMGELAQRYSLTHAAMRSQGAVKDDLAAQRSDLARQVTELGAAQDAADQAERAAQAALVEAEDTARVAAQSKEKVAALVAERERVADIIRGQREAEEAELAALQEEARALEEEMRQLAREERQRAADQAREAHEAAARKAAAEAAQRKADEEAAELRREEERKAELAAGQQTARPAPAKPSAAPVTPTSKQPPEPERKPQKFTLTKPTNGRVSSQYGMRRHPIYKTQRMHTGLDLAAGCGTPVRAAASGTVHKAGRAGGYGNQVVINHGTQGGAVFATSYSHLKSFPVVKGKKVKRGQVIGYEGTTGSSTGCHVHFEVFRNGDRVDPAKYLP